MNECHYSQGSVRCRCASAPSAQSRSAERMTLKSADRAVAGRLGQICLAQAQQSVDIRAQIEALKK